MAFSPNDLGPPKNGEKSQKVKKPPPFDFSLWPIEYLCKFSGSNSLKRREVLPMSVFWVITVNQPVR